MSDMPEKITAWVNPDGSTQFEAGQLCPKGVAREYVRDDLAKPKVRPLVWMPDPYFGTGYWKAETAIGIVRCDEDDKAKYEKMHKERILEALE